jgi:hypothetical protein
MSLFRALLHSPGQALRRLAATLRGAVRTWKGADLLQGTPRPGAPRLLIVANVDPAGPGQLWSSLVAFMRHSRFQVDLVNIRFAYWIWDKFLPEDFPLGDYDVILLHPTVGHRAEYIRAFDRDCKTRLEDFKGLRVIQLQDEHVRTNERIAAIRERGFDLLLTCVPRKEIPRVYHLGNLPDTDTVSVLTGYVTEEMRAVNHPWGGPRPLDISYRGNLVPFHYGRLPYEKHALGERFKKIAAVRGLRVDISSEWYHRVYGRHWLQLLGRSKAVLGVESGCTLFDLDGDIETGCAAYLREHPRADFEQVWEAVAGDREENVDYRQVSPRHFEAAACQAVQILYEGRYSGIFEPWKHYLPLKWDHSNLDEILEAMQDPERRGEIASQAYEEIVCDSGYSYASHVRRVDGELLERIE